MKENQGLVAEEEEGGITDRDDQRQEWTEAGGILFPELRNKNTGYAVKFELWLLACAYVL